MREQMRLLVELQKVDSVIGEMKKKKDETPKRIMELQNVLDAMASEVEQYKTELEELKRDRRTKEGLLQMEIERMHRSEEKLKEIKTQKEYQAVLKEIEQGKKLNVSREEDVLKLIADIEEREKIVAEKEEALKVKREGYAKEKDLLGKELSAINAAFDDKKKKWEEISKNVNTNILRIYKKVADRRNSTPVVPAKDGACTGCHMNLPPQLYNQVQKGGEVFQCPNCHRILYWAGKDS